MTRLLLDTHVFVWWVLADSRVKQSWIEPIVDPENSVFVSAATAWEIETKKRIGELSFEHDVADIAPKFGFELLSITVEQASAAGALDWHNRDPFDRMLVAQAITQDLTLVTADDAVRSAPGIRVL
ncbi:MAG: type II toxin-antitoxin system VapC family toxin [Lacisediminihabitans sp.]